MQTTTRLIVAGVLASASLFAAPAITGIVSSASLLPPGTPNGAVALGAIFNVFGSGLGPAAILTAPLPLPTLLGGTTIDIKVGATTVQAPMFYTVASQLAAILPSNTPLGTGTVTVKFGGASATSAITVVASNVGIYTVNQSGSGTAVVTYANTTSYVSTSNSAKAGDVLTLWATGLGAISTSDANPPNPVDLGTPIVIYIGGVKANLLYRGRSGYVGLDQINFTVPQGVPPGCAVSLVIQTNNLVSNGTTISVMPAGGVCSDANNILSPAQLSTLQGKSTIKLGSFEYSQYVEISTVNGKPAVITNLSADAILFSIKQADLPVLLTQIQKTTLGSCVVTVVKGPNNGGGDDALGKVATFLNAGGNLIFVPPTGSPLTLTSANPGQYGASPASYLAGTYVVSAPGGPDVAAFSTSFNVPPVLSWTNQAAISTSTIDRTQPLTFTWSGGDPNGYVDILLRAGTGNGNTQVEVDAHCAAPIGPGSFTVPPSVLLSLPSAGTSGQFGYYAFFTLAANASPQVLAVPGLDLAVGQVSNEVQAGVVLK